MDFFSKPYVLAAAQACLSADFLCAVLVAPSPVKVAGDRYKKLLARETIVGEKVSDRG
ncbi:hypothetical protein [Rubidibacter lacunae]|uniref:hypothetical protein n=1 Tax=Rubidibacter lacunae TaxID=582514 RepID=UPI0003FAE491|nr:hypothetical protein [Rubidibacter lacunae]